MTRDTATDHVLATFIDDGPTSGPKDLLARSLVATRSTRQRPAWLSRLSYLPERQGTALIAATVATGSLLFALGLGTLVRPTIPAVGGPSPTPVPSLSPGSSPVASPSVCMGAATCLGILAAGTHSAPGSAIDFTVPAGWMNMADAPGWFLLAPVAATPRDPATGKWLAVIRDVVITEQPLDCTPSPKAGVGRTVDAMISSIASHPGLVTSNVQPATVGGLSGKSIDLQIAPSWTTACGGGSMPEVSLLTETQPDGWRWSVGVPELQRLTFLDDRMGGVIAVCVNSPTPQGFDAMIGAAAPIIETFRFHLATATPSGGAASQSPEP